MEKRPAGMAPVLTVTPNPFNAAVKISWQYAVGSRQQINISIYNCRGKLVEKLPIAYCILPTEVTWNPAGLPAGIYLARINTGQYSFSKKLVLTR